jgi:protease-4
VALRRGFGVVLALLSAAILISLAGVALLWIVTSRQPTVAEHSTLVLDLRTDLREASPDDVVQQFLAGRQPQTLSAVIENLRKAKIDKRIGAVIITPSGLQAPLWGKVQELRDAIVDFRRSGKPAIAYLEYGDDRTYYLATACSQIFLMPTSSI